LSDNRTAARAPGAAGKARTALVSRPSGYQPA